MSVKTCRVLQIVAFVFFALAFLGSVLAIPFQKSLVSIYTSDPEILSQFHFPWQALLRSFLLLIPALIYLILVLQPMSPGGSKATVIVLAIHMGILLALILPLLSMFITTEVAREGQYALAHYNDLNGITSAVTSFLTVPAEILMFLSMGGFFGKDSRR